MMPARTNKTPVDWNGVYEFVFGVILKKFRNLPRQVVEDCADIVFIYLFEGGIAKARDPRKLDAFLARVAINKTIDHIRKIRFTGPDRAARVDLEKVGAGEEDVEEFVLGRDFAVRFLERMHALTDKCRAALHYYFLYKSGDDRFPDLRSVCGYLGVNINNFVSDVRRCLKSLQDGLRVCFNLKTLAVSGVLNRAALEIIVPALEKGDI